MKQILFAAAAMLACATVATSQTMSYGPNINIETAKKLAAPAIAEARKNNWNMAIAIVDTAGDLVYFEKMDDTQIGSVQVAQSQGALRRALQAPDQGVSGRAGCGRRGLAYSRPRRSDSR